MPVHEDDTCFYGSYVAKSKCPCVFCERDRLRSLVREMAGLIGYAGSVLSVIQHPDEHLNALQEIISRPQVKEIFEEEAGYTSTVTSGSCLPPDREVKITKGYTSKCVALLTRCAHAFEMVRGTDKYILLYELLEEDDSIEQLEADIRELLGVQNE